MFAGDTRVAEYADAAGIKASTRNTKRGITSAVPLCFFDSNRDMIMEITPFALAMTADLFFNYFNHSIYLKFKKSQDSLLFYFFVHPPLLTTGMPGLNKMKYLSPWHTKSC
jgi:hypothetical protein